MLNDKRHRNKHDITHAASCATGGGGGGYVMRDSIMYDRSVELNY